MEETTNTEGQSTNNEIPGASRLFPKVSYAPNPYFEASSTETAAPEEAATGNEGSAGDTRSSGDSETFVSETERGSVDFSSPEYKHLQAAYTKARQRDKAEIERLLRGELDKIRAELGSTKAEPAASQEVVETQDAPAGIDDYYKVSLDAWTPSFSFPKDSDLAGYEEAFTPAIKQSINDAVQHVLGQLASKARAYESQQKQSTVVNKIQSFENEISVHPEFENKLPEIRDLATKFRQVAMEDPDTWIALVEAKTGLRRGWQNDEVPNDKVVPLGINNASKTRAAVQRPTRPVAAASAPRQFKTVNDGIDAAFAQFGLGRH